jgi:hypothetical protein
LGCFGRSKLNGFSEVAVQSGLRPDSVYSSSVPDDFRPSLVPGPGFRSTLGSKQKAPVAGSATGATVSELVFPSRHVAPASDPT